MISASPRCQSAEVNSSPIYPNAGRLVAFGDSITRGYGVPAGDGWVELLSQMAEDQIGHKIDVINAGGNGNTSREGLARFDTDIQPFLPATVLIEFGGNDPVNEAARHVTPEEFRHNLSEIVDKVRKAGGDCVILTFPTVISSLHMTATDPAIASRGGLDKVIASYRDLARQYAAQEEVPLLDLDVLSRSWIDQLGYAEVIAPDGIHWTSEANRLAAIAVLEFLQGRRFSN